jgi:hypothetical protein
MLTKLRKLEMSKTVHNLKAYICSHTLLLAGIKLEFEEVKR